MTSFHLKDGVVFASHIDVKRVATKLRKQFADLTANQALDLAAQLFGARDEYDMRQRAADPDISRLSNDQVNGLLQDSACHSGQKFPARLPAKFAKDWQKKAQQLFAQAVAAREPGQLEFVALIGSERSGKTLLANHMCHFFGGYVADVELYDPFAWLNISGYKKLDHKPGEVLIYDRPTQAATTSESDTLLSSRGLDGLHSNIGNKYQSLEQYRKAKRCPRPLIPGEAFGRYGRYGHFGSGSRDWVLQHSHTTMVICFANRDQVEEAINWECSAPLMSRFIGPYDWRRAHVVDLDSMTQYTVDGPGAAKEKLLPASSGNK